MDLPTCMKGLKEKQEKNLRNVLKTSKKKSKWYHNRHRSNIKGIQKLKSRLKLCNRSIIKKY